MDAHGFTELIATLSDNAATGRLEIFANGNEGALLFNSGKLVAARIGHLTGFQAINALASMREARFHFDPSAAVPHVSSITPSERLVLKQFFGIESADSHEHAAPAPAPVEETTVVTSEPSSVTSEASSGTREATVAQEEMAQTYHAPMRLRYLAVSALAVVLIAVVAGAVLLREKFRERSAGATVAATTETVSPAPAQPSVKEEPNVNEAPRVTQESPITEKPVADSTARVNDPPSVNENPSVNEKPSGDEGPRVKEPVETTLATTPNLTGDWNVVNTVATSSYRSFQNLRLGFALSFNQTGTTFTAKGQKVSENGRTLPAKSRTPIELKGVINGDRIEATFYEHGTTRKSNGRFVWKIDREGGGLTGTFDSNAARTSGKSVATREL